MFRTDKANNTLLNTSIYFLILKLRLSAVQNTQKRFYKLLNGNCTNDVFALAERLHQVSKLQT